MPSSGSGEEGVKQEVFFFPHNQDMGIISYLLSSKGELSLKNPKQSCAGRIEDDPIKVGLKTLIDPSPHSPRIVHSHTGYTVSTAWKPPPPPSSMFRSRVTDDVIGTESGDYMSSNVEDLKGEAVKAEPRRNRTRSRYRKAEMREFPRPISLLTQTGGMPWVFRRENIDGRLTVRAERMERRECFEAQRLNGRLTMKLVPRGEDTVYCEDCGHPITDRRDEQEEGERDGFWLHGSPTKQETECIGSQDGSVQELDPLWKGKGMEGPSWCMGRPSSSPLRPIMTPVM